MTDLTPSEVRIIIAALEFTAAESDLDYRRHLPMDDKSSAPLYRLANKLRDA